MLKDTKRQKRQLTLHCNYSMTVDYIPKHKPTVRFTVICESIFFILVKKYHILLRGKQKLTTMTGFKKEDRDPDLPEAHPLQIPSPIA